MTTWNDVNNQLSFWVPTGQTGDLPLALDLLDKGWMVSALSADQENLVRSTLFNLYTGSDTAQSILNQVVINPLTGQSSTFLKLYLIATNAGSQAKYDVNIPSIAINFEDPQRIQNTPFDGKFKSLDLERLLIHEVIHAILDFKDIRKPDGSAYLDTEPTPRVVDYNHPDFDHLGETVRLTNQIR